MTCTSNTPLYMGDNPENYVTLLKWPKPLPQISSLAGTKGAGCEESQLWEVARQNTRNTGKVLMHIEVFVFSIDEFWEFWSSSHQEEDTLTHEVFPSECKCLLQNGNFLASRSV